MRDFFSKSIIALWCIGCFGCAEGIETDIPLPDKDRVQQPFVHGGDAADCIEDCSTPFQSVLEEWQALLQTVRRVHPHLAGFAQDSTLLARLLGEGQYVVHHSQPFNDTYHPHYRIIRRDVFEELIQPHL